MWVIRDAAEGMTSEPDKVWDKERQISRVTGMNEITEKLTLPDTCRSDHVVVQKVTATANLGRVPCGTSDEYRY